MRRLWALLASILALVLVASGCSGSTGSSDATAASSGSKVVTVPGSPHIDIVAGSEHRTVLDQLVMPWCRSKGYGCSYTLKGSVDQARLLAAGSTDYDVYWFASSVFAQLGNTHNTLTDVKPTFLTPVVFAGRTSTMTSLGLTGSDVTAAKIIDVVESGKVTTWTTNPTQSNSGATVLFSFLNHFAGNAPGQALTREQLNSKPVVEGMQKFFKAIDRTPPSTGTMTDQCVADLDTCQTMFTYEDLVIEKNKELVAKGAEPLHVAYPKGALAISDAPMGFDRHGQSDLTDRQRVFRELQTYLLTDASASKELLKLGRRPASAVGLSLQNPDETVFNPDWGIRATIRDRVMTYPTAPIIEAALAAYHSQYRTPVAVKYCLDGSGSMSGAGWDGVSRAADALFDPEQAKRNLLQTGPDDLTTVMIFNSEVTVGPRNVQGDDYTELVGVKNEIQSYDPHGGTNMYACLSAALDQLAGERSRKRLIVVMSDGKSTSDGYRSVMDRLRTSGVPVVTIAFGDSADPQQLTEVAKASEGSFVNSSDMVSALRQAAGYR